MPRTISELVTCPAEVALRERQDLDGRDRENEGRAPIFVVKAPLRASYCHRPSHFVAHALARRSSMSVIRGIDPLFEDGKMFCR